MKWPEATKRRAKESICTDSTTEKHRGSYQSRASTGSFGVGEIKGGSCLRNNRNAGKRQQVEERRRLHKMTENALMCCCFKCKLEESLIAPQRMPGRDKDRTSSCKIDKIIVTHSSLWRQTKLNEDKIHPPVRLQEAGLSGFEPTTCMKHPHGNRCQSTCTS